jgi:hypothetical protein
MAADALAAMVARVEAAPSAHKAAEEFIYNVGRLIRTRAGEPGELIAFANLLDQDAERLGGLIGEASWRAALRERARMRPVGRRTPAVRRDSGRMYRTLTQDEWE